MACRSSELDFQAQPCDGIGIQTSRRRFAPIDICVPGIAAFFDRRVWVEQSKGRALRYVFFGLRGDRGGGAVHLWRHG